MKNNCLTKKGITAIPPTAKVRGFPCGSYHEKRFEWLKNVGPMTIDFYLPEYNIAIECQGEQHYRPVKYFGGPGELVKDMKRDKVKEKLLLEHEITPIYFSAEKYRDDALTEVEEVLNKILEKK